MAQWWPSPTRAPSTRSQRMSESPSSSSRSPSAIHHLSSGLSRLPWPRASCPPGRTSLLPQRISPVPWSLSRSAPEYRPTFFISRRLFLLNHPFHSSRLDVSYLLDLFWLCRSGISIPEPHRRPSHSSLDVEDCRSATVFPFLPVMHLHLSVYPLRILAVWFLIFAFFFPFFGGICRFCFGWV